MKKIVTLGILMICLLVAVRMTTFANAESIEEASFVDADDVVDEKNVERGDSGIIEDMLKEEEDIQYYAYLTFLVSKDTRIPISTTITIEFTYKSNTNGGYSIVSVDSAKAENNSGWTCVDSKATVDGDILYSNERREAAIPISYQASLGDGLRPQECLIRLDLSQEQ